ncbi:glycosyltransferase family 4 protein [Candidatus Pelagibacter sp. HIMB1483]|uniref:glycosyltransferase family 4 protein n=1 Tax=Candidatus Pelagibacter sp. HIMB1483 TaxID=3415414 RepID=UPI003F8334AD
MVKLHIVTNDKVWFSKKNFTSNNDLDNIISCLIENYDVQLICRKSLNKLNFLIKSKFNFCNLKKISEEKLNLLLISISPYNFFILFYLLFFKRVKVKGFVYLRSDGFLEYKYRYGIIGFYIYFIMFFLIKRHLKIISCSKNFTYVDIKKVIHPSELTSEWFKKKRKKNTYKFDFLYVGRFKKDKGAIFLSEIFKEKFRNYKLAIVGTNKNNIKKNFYSKNIIYMDSISNLKNLINIYDSSRIFILPSYIEGFPKVISESLARLRPIIVFEDIKYVKNGRDGIFICKRDEKSLRKTIKYILKNYKYIQKKIQKNYFYTKKNFQNELLASLNNEFSN